MAADTPELVATVTAFVTVATIVRARSCAALECGSSLPLFATGSSLPVPCRPQGRRYSHRVFSTAR